MACGDPFLRSQEDKEWGNQGQQVRLHRAGDFTEGAILQHSQRDDTGISNCATHL